MAKKTADISKINTGNIYTNKTIADATQEAPATQKAQEKATAPKGRKTYSEQEAAEFMRDMNTAGRKGVHLPRINLAFTPETYDYVKTMSKITGMTYTEFINKILQDHKAAHDDVYKKAIEIRNSL